MADLSVDISKLPDEIRDKLAELDLELSEGDITQKGYEKKRTRLLAPFVAQPQQPVSSFWCGLRCTGLMPRVLLRCPRSRRNRRRVKCQFVAVDGRWRRVAKRCARAASPTTTPRFRNEGQPERPAPIWTHLNLEHRVQ
ncbi:DMAP1-binding domain-containing protein [Phthorimaea operculella]|nr:DMAP1-binding domain-containing protein [Phthorimaea operculella]